MLGFTLNLVNSFLNHLHVKLLLNNSTPVFIFNYFGSNGLSKFYVSINILIITKMLLFCFDVIVVALASICTNL